MRIFSLRIRIYFETPWEILPHIHLPFRHICYNISDVEVSQLGHLLPAYSLARRPNKYIFNPIKRPNETFCSLSLSLRWLVSLRNCKSKRGNNYPSKVAFDRLYIAETFCSICIDLNSFFFFLRRSYRKNTGVGVGGNRNHENRKLLRRNSVNRSDYSFIKIHAGNTRRRRSFTFLSPSLFHRRFVI